MPSAHRRHRTSCGLDLFLSVTIGHDFPYEIDISALFEGKWQCYERTINTSSACSVWRL
jgi:hypothetical protein